MVLGRIETINRPTFPFIVKEELPECKPGNIFDIFDQLPDLGNNPPIPSEKQEEEERLKKRMENCGRTGVRIDPLTGGPVTFAMYCEVYSMCPRCAAKRKEEIVKRVNKANFKSDVMWVESDCQDITHGADKKLLLKVPLESGKVMIFFDHSLQNHIESAIKEEEAEGEVRPLAEFKFKKWEELGKTPRGKRLYGSLGKASPVKDEEDDKDSEVVSFKQEVIIVSSLDDNVKQAVERAIEKTSDLDPDDEQSLKTAIKVRTSAIKCELDLEGISYTKSKSTVRVALNRIHWKNTSSVCPHCGKIVGECCKSDIWNRSDDEPVPF